jgi:hypothetical protein
MRRVFKILFHKKSRIPYIKVYGFFLLLSFWVRINMIELQLNINREGRPRGVAPTVRIWIWWHIW